MSHGPGLYSVNVGLAYFGAGVSVSAAGNHLSSRVPHMTSAWTTAYGLWESSTIFLND